MAATNEPGTSDAADFRASVRLIRRSIWQLLRRSSSSMSDDGQEIVQIVFLKLFEVLRARGTAVRSSNPYVRAMARNATLDLLRSRRRHLFVSEVGDRPSEKSMADPADEATLSQVQAHIDNLPSDLAGVFAMRFVKKLSQTQACRELSISRQHLRTLEGRLKGSVIDFLQARERPTTIIANSASTKELSNQNDSRFRL